MSKKKKPQLGNGEGEGYLELNKEHKKWYDGETGMGKQRGKPHAVPPKIKKQKGEHKCSLFHIGG